MRSPDVALTLFCLSLSLILSLLCTSAAAVGGHGAFNLNQARSPGDAIANTFIVEFYESQDQNHHQGLLGFLSQLLQPIGLTPLLQFNATGLFVGLSLRLDNPDDVHTLLSYKGTKAVHPVQRVKLTKSSAVTPMANVASVNETTKKTAVSTLASEPLAMMAITRLHAEGQYGAGVLVGIIDTGVDYSHPALNGGRPAGTRCFGPGCPIEGGHAFVNDNGDRVDSADPFADCAEEGGHGSHCLGLLIGNHTATGFLGVAPAAKARMYRAVDCSGSTTTDILLAAMLKAYEDKVDILSMSIAGLSGWPEDLISRTASRLVDAGIAVVAANGNDGESGLFYSSHPASARGAAGIGSVQNSVLHGWSVVATSNGTHDQHVSYVTANAFVVNGTSTKLKVYPAINAFGKSGDPCSSYPGNTPNLTSMLVLIERSPNCGPKDQVDNAVGRGARYIFFYMPEGQGMRTIDTDRDSTVQLAVVPRAKAMRLIQATGSGDVFIDFAQPAQNAAVPDRHAGGTMSYFSTYSPTWEMEIGSAVTAVGGNVLSTWPVNQGMWAIASGTSTATPMVAGAYALLKGMKGKNVTPAAIRAALTSTAAPVPLNKASASLDTVARQGGGLMQVYQAAKSVTTAWPDRLNLNDTQFFNGTQSLTITNIGTSPQKFSMLHIPAGTVYALSSGGNGVFNGGPVALVDGEQASVTFSPASFSLPAKASQVVQITFTPPASKQTLLPVYSGYVKAVSDNRLFGNASVPYLGLAAALSSLPVLNVTTSYDSYNLPGLLDPSFGAQINDDGGVFSLEDQYHQPALLFGQTAGTLAWSVDLVLANTTFNGSVPLSRRHLHARAPMSFDSHRFRRLHHSKRGLGPVTGSPQIVGTIRSGETLPRDANTYSTIMVNQTVFDEHGVSQQVQDGSYRVLLRVLKLRGNRDQEDSYESYLSHAFAVRRNKST